MGGVSPLEPFRPDLNVRMMCPDCKENSEIIEEFSSGDIVCNNCGLVLGDRVVDTRSEWRTFADSEGDDPSRVGGPGDPLLSGASQLSSVISFKDGNSGVARGLQRAAAQVSSRSGEKLLVEAFEQIQIQCDRISLPRVVSDSAKQLFKRQEEEKLLKAKPQAAIIAACIFIACRDQRVERTFKEIVSLTNVPKKQIAQCFSKMSQVFGVQAANVGDSSAAGIVSRFCNHLGLPPALQSATIEVVRKIDDLGILAGRSPLTIAAACVYFTSHAFGLGKSSKEIGKVASIGESTLKTAYKILLTKRNELLAEKWFKERGPKSLIADLDRIPSTGDKAAAGAAATGDSPEASVKDEAKV